jgi:uncharacterized membrane protein HdeD (DUF308 family)
MDTLIREWWALLCRAFVSAIAAMAFASVAFGWFWIGDSGMQRLIAMWLLGSGACGLLVVRGDLTRWRTLATDGACTLLVGLVLWADTVLNAAALSYVVGAWAILDGVALVSAGGRVRAALGGELNLAAAGVTSVLIGAIVASLARVGATAVLAPLTVLTVVQAFTFLRMGMRLHHGGIGRSSTA